MSGVESECAPFARLELDWQLEVGAVSELGILELIGAGNAAHEGLVHHIIQMERKLFARQHAKLDVEPLAHEPERLDVSGGDLDEIAGECGAVDLEDCPRELLVELGLDVALFHCVLPLAHAECFHHVHERVLVDRHALHPSFLQI